MARSHTRRRRRCGDLNPNSHLLLFFRKRALPHTSRLAGNCEASAMHRRIKKCSQVRRHEPARVTKSRRYLRGHGKLANVGDLGVNPDDRWWPFFKMIKKWVMRCWLEPIIDIVYLEGSRLVCELRNFTRWESRCYRPLRETKRTSIACASKSQL